MRPEPRLPSPQFVAFLATSVIVVTIVGLAIELLKVAAVWAYLTGVLVSVAMEPVRDFFMEIRDEERAYQQSKD